MNSINDRIETLEIDDDDNAPIPGTVFNKRQARMLKYVVIFMGLLLIAGFALMIGIIAYRASQPAKPKAPIAPAGISVPIVGANAPSLAQQPTIAALASEPRTIEALIPKGAIYLGSTINGDRLIVTLQTPNKGLRLMMIDLRTWKITGTAQLNQQR